MVDLRTCGEEFVAGVRVQLAVVIISTTNVAEHFSYSVGLSAAEKYKIDEFVVFDS